MANEALIAYENTEKQKNLDDIASLDSTITSIDSMISKMNVNIGTYNDQKTQIQQNISDLQDGNNLIDQIITILSA